MTSVRKISDMNHIFTSRDLLSKRLIASFNQLLFFILLSFSGGFLADPAIGEELNFAPDCSNAYASIDSIWPPNHTFTSLKVFGVTDPDGDEAQYAGAARHHEYMGNVEYRKECGIRAGAESLLNEIAYAHDGRQSRHRYEKGSRLQLVFAGISCNVKRFIRYTQNCVQISVNARSRGLMPQFGYLWQDFDGNIASGSIFTATW